MSSAANLISAPNTRLDSKLQAEAVSKKKTATKNVSAINISGQIQTTRGLFPGNYTGTEQFKVAPTPTAGKPNPTSGVGVSAKSKAVVDRSQSTSEYRLQRESENFDVKNTLVDSVNFFLTGLESAKLLHNDPELQEVCGKDPTGKNFLDFATTIKQSIDKNSANLASFLPKLTEADAFNRLEQYLGLLAMGVAVPLLKEKLADSPQAANPKKFGLSEVANRFLQTVANPNSDSKSLSALLVAGLYFDLPSAKSGFPIEEMKAELLGTGSSLASILDQKSAQSCFAHLLTEFERGNIPDEFEFDEAAENAVTHFREWQLGQYVHQNNGIAVGGGHVVDIPELKSTFSRFDLSNNFTVGTFKVAPRLIANIAHREFTFCFQDGRKYFLKKIAVLPEVQFLDFKGLDATKLAPLYPRVNAAIQKLETREQFARADFDWVHLQFNLHENRYYWSVDELPAPSDYTQSVTQQMLFAIKRKAGKFALTPESLVVPVHRGKGEFCPRTKDGNGAVPLLFVRENGAEATVGELVDFVNGAFSAAQLARPLNKPIEPKDLMITAMGPHANSRLSDRKREVLKSRDQKLRDLILSLAIDPQVLKKQAIPFEVILNSKDAREADSSLPSVGKGDGATEDSKLIHVGSNETIKSTLTQFMTFLHKNALPKQTYLSKLHLLRNRTPGFWLPSILILDVRIIGERLVSPFDDMRVTEISSKMLADSGMVINTHYVPIGLICQLKNFPGEYYPVRTIWGKQPTAIGYLGKQRKATRGQLDDSCVHFVILERKEAEIEETA